MLLSILMLSIEVVVKLSQLPEDAFMLVSLLLSQFSKNHFSWLRSKPLMMPLVEFIKP
jgi:uncharacterized membrane protein YbaN (DUF454 family)